MAKKCSYDGCIYDVFSHGYCRIHQWCRQDKTKPTVTNSINPRKQSYIKPKKKASGELFVFREIWSERPHVSQISGTPVMFSPSVFHHVITKGSDPSLRLVKENIVIVTKQEHNALHSFDSIDTLIEKDNRYLIIKEIRDKMKQYGRT